MLNLLYQFIIKCYGMAIAIAALFNEKAKLLKRGQQQSFSYLKEKISHHHPIVWIHAASLGEFEQGRPLIEHIKTHFPNYQILLTFFSPSGYEVRKNYTEADYICYLPLDSRKNAHRFLEITKPELVFFVKYEFWTNYFQEIKSRNIPLYMVSCIFRQEQTFFKTNAIGKWYQKTLHHVNHFFVQHEDSGKLLEKIKLNNFTITGDTRFDRVHAIAQQGKQLPIVAQFKGNSKLLVVGSSWLADEEILKPFIDKNPHIKVIFAPHELKETNINRLLNFGTKALKYSQLNESELNSAQVLVIDCMGLLSSIYRYADVSYIGGGFGVGIHNTLEAAIFNIPVVFGPNHKRFNEALELINRKIAFSIASSTEANEELQRLFNSEEIRVEIAKKCQSFMLENIGATSKIAQFVFHQTKENNKTKSAQITCR